MKRLFWLYVICLILLSASSTSLASFPIGYKSYTDWVEDIVVDAFPPDGPGGLAAIVCPKCGGHFRYDPSVPVKRSLQHPDHSF